MTFRLRRAKVLC